MEKKYQVFISSTFTDLKSERQDITRAILNLDHIPAGMELFPAIDESQFDYIMKVIDDCDYYVLIIGGRYGSIDSDGIGYTEKEFDYAVSNGLKVIALIHNDVTSIALAKSETEPKLREKLDAFRSKAQTGRLAKFWSDGPSLLNAFYESFSLTVRRHPAVGWVRADTASNHDLLVQLNNVRAENDKLKEQIGESSRTPKNAIIDLAPLESHFSLHYRYDGFQSGVLMKYKDTVELTWKTILCAFGPSYLQPGRTNGLAAPIKSYLKEKGVVKAIEEIYMTDIDVIKAQFVALGFLQIGSGEDFGKSGGEFAVLTAEGQAAMLEALTVRG